MIARSKKAHRGRTFALAGAVLAAIPACEDLKAGAGAAPPAIELRQVTLRQYGGELLEGVGKADVISYLRDTGQLSGRTLAVDVLPSPHVGRGGLHIEAPRGKGDVRGQTALLEGGVHVVSAAGDKAESKAAVFSAADDTIRGGDPLHATGPGYDLAGTRWIAHVHERRLEMASGVVLRTPEGRR